MPDELRRLRTQAERDADDHTWRATANEPRCTIPAGTCYCTDRSGCLRTNEDAYDAEEPA